METKKMYGLERLIELQEQTMADARRKCEQMQRDYDMGCEDCKSGSYDKWYRYNRADDGAAYDAGWVAQNHTTMNETVRFVNNSSGKNL